ncbi:264_t:CDS:2 [Gigaspora rosea]|nr:264_t:CDS:2 [Gigaspora rosea]
MNSNFLLKTPLIEKSILSIKKMEEICEIVPSQKGMNKINICRATTVFVNNLHYLKKFNKHNQQLQASSAEIARSIASIRDRAHETNDQPAQIIQNTIVNIPKKIYPYILSHNAFSTLSGEDFLVRDSIIEDERILLFTTKANIQHLSKSSY